MNQELHLIEERPPAGSGILLGILLSLAVHVVLLGFWTYRALTAPPPPKKSPIEYVELQPRAGGSAADRVFTEAPGAATTQTPSPDAPFSNRNRRAATPNPTGEKPTLRPGSGGAYIPPMGNPGQASTPSPPTPAMQAQRGSKQDSEHDRDPSKSSSDAALAFREPSAREPAASDGAVDWKSAIREAGKMAALGGGGAGASGGESGFAESGPVSFETQWYPWGDYADAMVRRIRINWYANMPEIIRMGLKGVVTIRFTIQRNGSITDLQVVQGSGTPPYDFAAKKAIELSSPLNPLPADFPNPSERVTCQFFYNSSPDRK
ncbi:MAG: TonB family protein [Thermoanaerobaculia bacterium]